MTAGGKAVGETANRGEYTAGMDGTLTEAPLDADVLCWKCRYNLRTRLPSQRCPECDTSIAESIDRGREWGALLSRPSWGANALLLLSISEAVDVIVSATGVMAPELFRLPAVYIAAMSVWLLALIGVTAGTIWFVLAIRPRLIGTPGEGWRLSVIGLRAARTCITLVALGLNAYLFYLAHFGLLAAGNLLLYAASTAMHIPSLIFGVLLEAIALPYFVRLCRAIRNRGRCT